MVSDDPGKKSELSHGDQIARISVDLPQWQPWFTSEILSGDDQYAVLVWTARGRTAERLLSGIEVFRVADGRITDVWNSPYASEPWA